MSTFNYSLSQLNDPRNYTHIQFPIKNESTDGKIGLIQDIDFGVMEGFGYVTNGNNESSQIKDFKSFVITLDLLFNNLNTRINDLKSIVDGLMAESSIASITTEPKAKSLTYDGTSKELITKGIANNGVMYYSSTYDGSYSESVPQGTNAGAYTVFYYAKGNTGYKDSPKRQLDVTIAKASSLKTAPTVASPVIIHDGSNHDLINAGTTNSGTMEYGFNFNDSSKNNPPSLWSSNIPQGKDSGTYYIWYRIENGVNSTNYKEVNPTYLASVTIGQSTTPVTSISLAPTSLTLNANESKTITATIEPSNATNKTINWSSSNTDVATVTTPTTSGQPATVTWKKDGTCTITATAAGSNPSVSATCTVTCALHPNNCYIGAHDSRDLTFTESDLNKYVPDKPEIIELPVGTVNDVSVWIYPQSWGKPIQANPIIDGSVDESKNHINAFKYSDITLPEGYTGCYLSLDSAATYKLTWQS